MHKNSFIRSVKGKILIAAALACLALFLAWSTSKGAFSAMLSAFENISAPNEKLRLVNDLSRGIARIDQVQRARSINNPDQYYGFNDSKELLLKIDSLQMLYPAGSAQVKRLHALKRLLQDRDRLFVNYLKVREGLIDNKSFSAQVESLNDIVDESAKQADSMATTTEKKTSTTTVYPETVIEKKDTRSFFNKLFGKRKIKDTDSLAKPFQIVAEEFKVKHDTLAKAIQDSLLKGLGQTMRGLERIQRKKSEQFVNRESVLVRSSENIVHQILSILKKVEDEVVIQTAENNAAAKSMVHSSIKRISLIMLAFVALTALLVYFILRDISRINKYRKDIEKARDEAEYHAQAKQRFLSNMSHEIRTPLQSIIGYAEIVKSQPQPNKKDIEAIHASSGHLMQVVNEVLDYSRIISGKITFVNQVFIMKALLDETMGIMRLQAEKKNIYLTGSFDASVSASVTGDPFRLKQVLFNLLGNAIKFTSAGGVTLSVQGTNTANEVQYHFDVTDTGTGIAEEDLGRIFKEFEQAVDENNNRAGTGLGLPITKELIESQGGNISVKSKPGEGSTFSFGLSFKRADEKPTSADEPANKPATLSGGKVWIVDDDTFILELCSRIFDDNGIAYRCFNSPHDILKAPWDDNVKYLLLDIRMPGMSGIELCAALRQQIPASVMIYALTAQALPGEQEAVLGHGFNGLLMKPFRDTELVGLVKGVKPRQKMGLQLNIKAIEKMTFGDTGQTAKILGQFASDSMADIKRLNAAVNAADIDNVRLIAHRIAGRTAQAGGGALAEQFRLAEMELAGNAMLTPGQVANISALTKKLRHLALAAKQYGVNETVG